MARKKTAPEGASVNALAADDGVTTPRIRLGEVGFAALKTRSGKILEQDNSAFRYPAMLKVVSEMVTSPPVAIGLQALTTLMNRSDIIVQPVVGEDDTDRARREFLESVFHDMTDSWQTTMQSISTFKEYGHQVSEMVFRRRLPANGSKFSDGLVGLAALKSRPQNSIARWNFDETGRKLVSISQSIANVENSYRFQNITDENGFIEIPREKFLLFRCDAKSDNPEGTSVLSACYLAYKQLTLLQDSLMLGIAKDTSGIPFASLPPKYLDPNASPEDKAVFTATQNILNSVADGTSRGIIFPKMWDNEGKTDLFDFKLLEQKNGKAYDLPAVIKMLQANILSVLSADSITMGADKGGSLSLQDGSTNMLALTVAYRLSEIANTLNQELIPLLWRLNSWDTTRMPKVMFSDISSVSKEEQSKWLQRVASVGLLELDRGMLNVIREQGGFDPRPDDEPIDIEHLSTTMAGKASSSSQGMAVGVTGDGTAKKPGGQDNSARNADNTA